MSNHPDDPNGVHASHCCFHGCKYNDPKCPVYYGKVPALYKQECCVDAEIIEREKFEEVIRFIKNKNATSITLQELEDHIKPLAKRREGGWCYRKGDD